MGIAACCWRHRDARRGVFAACQAAFSESEPVSAGARALPVWGVSGLIDTGRRNAITMGFQLFCILVNSFGPSKNFEAFVQ